MAVALVPAAAKADKGAAKRIRIGPGRLSFPYIFAARDTDNGAKYQTSLLLPPDYDTKPLLAALEAAAVEAWGKDKSKWPPKARRPEDVIRPCEEKPDLAGYEPGWHFISASGNEPPGVVDASKEDVTDPKAAYAGRWAILACNAFAFRNKTVGVSLGLNNVQLLKRDTVLGRGNPQTDFDDMSGEPEEEGGFE